MEPKTITISGPPASGTSSTANKLAEELGFDLVNGGDIFRKMAKERGLTLAELTQKSEENPEIDKRLDDRLKDRIVQHATGNSKTGLIAESRLAGWHGSDVADLSIYLTASSSVRLKRAEGRDEESVEEFKERERSERERYIDFYDVDYTNEELYDVVINTETKSKDEVVEKIIAVLTGS